MDLGTMQLLNAERAQRWHEQGEPWTIADWCTAMAGEMGEACNVAKKIRRAETGAVNQGDPTPQELREMLGTELADTVIYAMCVASSQGIDLETAIIDKFNLVSAKHSFPERMQH